MPALFKPYLSLDLLASLLTQAEAARPPLIIPEAVEQPNTNLVGAEEH
jgi:hypothetical protein